MSKELVTIFKKLKTMHILWIGGDVAYKERIEKSLEPTFKELEKLGVARHFGESLLFWGREFAESFVLESKKRKELLPEDAAAILGGKVRDMTDREKRAHKLAEKAGAQSYTILPDVNGKMGIEIHFLKENKQGELLIDN